MHVSKITDFENKVLSSGLGHLDMTTFTFPVTGEQGLVLSGVVCHRKDGQATYYYPEKTPKERIVLHFTAGNLRGDLITLTGDQHVSVPYVIARNGTIFQLFNPEHWSYHLGRGSVGGNTAQSKVTIGIELSNYGPLHKRGDQLETIYTKPERPDIYSMLNERESFIEIDSPFRDHLYFASYTDEQYDSLIKLLRHLTSEFDIPRNFLSEDRRYGTTDDVLSFRGIVSHINYRQSGKWDIGPAFDWNRVIAGVQSERYTGEDPIELRIRRVMDKLETARQELHDLETRIMGLEDELKQLEEERESGTRSFFPVADILSEQIANEKFEGDRAVQRDYGADGPETGYDPTLLDDKTSGIMDKTKVKENELKRLLNNPNTSPEELAKYFEVEFDAPFDGYLKLRADVEVIPESVEEGQRGFVQNLIVSWANSWARANRNKKYRQLVNEDPKRPRLISEGDSWFQHPHPKVLDTIDQLMNHYPIYSIGAAGDTLRNMFYEGEFMKAIREERPRIFLLSGGGNDILGRQFRGFLEDNFDPAPPGEDPARFLKPAFDRELDTLRNVYESVFTKLRNQPIDVVIHGYDYVLPWDTPDKGWLGRYMIEKGIDSREDRVAIIRFMIDEFNDRLMQASAGFDNVHYIDLRNTVRSDQWYDEIHPTSEGYQDVALKFHAVIDRILSN